MCTAIHKNHLFGRTLDFERSFGESVALTPRNLPIPLLRGETLSRHLSFLGCAHVHKERPLYYDAVNEAGLAAAALNFPLSAQYTPPKTACQNLASFELIPAVLGQCATLSEAKTLLEKVHVTDDAVCKTLPPTPLHWIIADRSGALVAEPTQEGLMLYDDPVGVLANEPPFPYHLIHLADFLSLSPEPPKNRFAPSAPLSPYSRGMGSMGLPGDFSSASRFVRAAYAREHIQFDPQENIESFFHLTDTVFEPKGLALTDQGEPIYTIYASCMDLSALTYSYVTYDHRAIQSYSMNALPLDSDRVWYVRMN